jgi:hypothetical protein
MSAFFRQILPPAAIALAVAATAAWISLLGYGIVALVGLAL